MGRQQLLGCCYTWQIAERQAKNQSCGRLKDTAQDLKGCDSIHECRQWQQPSGSQVTEPVVREATSAGPAGWPEQSRGEPHPRQEGCEALASSVTSPPAASGCKIESMCSSSNPWTRAATWSLQLLRESLDDRIMQEPLSSNFLFSLSRKSSSTISCFNSAAFVHITPVFSVLRG